MKRKKLKTSKGSIVYWTNEKKADDVPQLVFLPGLTADHRLFIKQIQYFQYDYSVLVWDAPGHAFSYPFEMDFTLEDKAKWLDEILIKEGYDHPIIIGQSMGGYVGQMYAELFPGKLAGFIIIDSAPIQRKYYKEWEIKSLEHTELMYRLYPWKLLLRHGTDGVATSRYGRGCMYRMMLTYDKDQARYAKLAGHGFYIVAQA
ncbi:MAG: alpha/beta hydrolase, partial [Lachnospiraceae bacterium]|nr:alpha/beta hydrolase [Lachnospiraceae bacterium]